MSHTYLVKKGDTLRKIANEFYSDSGLYKKLADYNGIMNPQLIQIGQVIEVPSKKELLGKTIEFSGAELAPPNGREQIIETFGDINKYILDDGTLNPLWESDQLARAPLPFSIPLSWDKSKLVSKIYCHKKLIRIFPDLFGEIEKKGLKKEVRTFGGCFNFRSKRTIGKLSTHSWGIAVDLNPETNPMGKPGDIHEGVVEIFRQFGFKWGGDWTGKGKDPMHFQFCTGY